MKPSERINRTYELKQTTVDISLDCGTVQVPVKVILELSPRPQLTLDCKFTWPELEAANEITARCSPSLPQERGRQI